MEEKSENQAPDNENEPEEFNCDGIECDECEDYCECTFACMHSDIEDIQETVGKSFLVKDLQMLVLKLVLRALLLKFNSKQANEAIKNNLQEQLLSCVPNILKDAEEDVKKENLSEEALNQMKKDVSKILLDNLNEVFLPPEGIANNL
jgi:hypothetical protein